MIRLIALGGFLAATVAMVIGIYAYGYRSGETAAKASQIAATDALNANVVAWATTRAAAVAALSRARREQAQAAAAGKLTSGSYDYAPTVRAKLTAITIGVNNAH